MLHKLALALAAVGLIAPAYAQGATPPAPNPIVQLIPFIAIFVIFYFFIIRPQNQARKKHMEMIANVRRGDQVVTSGGIVGKVTKVLENDEIMVEIAKDVTVKVMKPTLSNVLTKPEPAANDQS
ncbi:MAG: preprotein translocase subunit YajC [Parvularculaceae bacterium]